MITVPSTHVWPQNLPDILMGGNTSELTDPYLTSQTEGGRDIIRRRFRTVPEFQEVRFIMTTAETSVFEYFWINIIDYGGAWFNIPIQDAVGYSNRVSRFRGQYTKEPQGAGKYEITATLETHQKQTITANEYHGIITPGLFDWADNGDWSTNGDWINVPRA